MIKFYYLRDELLNHSNHKLRDTMPRLILILCLFILICSLTNFAYAENLVGIEYSDGKEIIDKLLAVDKEMQRGEFEKQAEYYNRKKKLIENNTKNIFFIKIDKTNEFYNDYINTSYDVDKELLHIITNSSKGGTKGFRYYEENTKIKNYIGQNSFGVRKEIEKIYSRLYVFGIINSKNDKGFDEKIKIDVQTMKDIKDNIAYVFECYPTIGNLFGSKEEKFTSDATSNTQPTISNPVDITKRMTCANIILKNIYVIDNRDSRIIKSFKIQN